MTAMEHLQQMHALEKEHTDALRLMEKAHTDAVSIKCEEVIKDIFAQAVRISIAGVRSVSVTLHTDFITMFLYRSEPTDKDHNKNRIAGRRSLPELTELLAFLEMLDTDEVFEAEPTEEGGDNDAEALS